jgi:membrane fusion protein (multidrug efflux system)
MHFLHLMKRRWKLIALGVIVLLIGGGFYARAQFTKAPEYRTETVQKRTIEKILEVSGQIEAKQIATLRFPAGGKTTYIGAKEGDWVKQWQTIASIDKKELQKNLQKDLNLYMTERLDFEQGKDDRKDIHGDTRTDRLSDQDQLSLENTVLTVELRDLAMKNTSLFTPIEGVLVSSPTDVAGTILSATDTFTIVNPESLVFSAEVDESDIALLREGQLGEIILDAYTNRPIKTSVVKIAFQSSEATTGTVFPIEFTLPSQESAYPFRLGMNGNVKISIDKKEDVLSVPIRSVIERDDKMFVEIKNGESIEQREVVVGLENDEFVEITDGLTESDTIVIR